MKAIMSALRRFLAGASLFFACLFGILAALTPFTSPTWWGVRIWIILIYLVGAVLFFLFGKWLSPTAPESALVAAGAGAVSLWRFLRGRPRPPQIPPEILRWEEIKKCRAVLSGEAEGPIVDGVFLGPNERSVWADYAAIVEDRAVGKHYEGGSSSVSIPTGIKGVRFRTGGHRGKVVTDWETIKEWGIFAITNERLIFLAQGMLLEVPIEKVVSIQESKRQFLVFQRGKKEPSLFELKNHQGELIQTIFGIVLQHSRTEAQ